VITIIRQSPRSFVSELDFKSSLGARDQAVITDLGVLRRGNGELVLEALHPGVELDRVLEATGWDLKVAGDLKTTEPPTERELAMLRELKAR
jgi:glutaconate CoA-transferase, subunit B